MIGRASLAGVLLAVIAAGPAAALDAEYDGIYGLMAGTYGRGGFIVEYMDSDEVRVTTALTGLAAGTEYRLILSKAPCGHANTDAKEVLHSTFTTDANGASYHAEVVPWLWFATAPVPRSARLKPVGGGPGTCVRAHAFERLSHSSSDEPAEMQYSRFWGEHRRGLVILDRLDGSTGRLSWSFSGLSPGTYRLTGASVSCAQAANSGNGTYSIHIGPDVHGNAVGNQDIVVENDETHWLGSNRIRRIGGGWSACRKASVTDLIIDPL